MNVDITKAWLSKGDFTVIGHSLGAHVAGYAGKQVGQKRVHTIVGLDPALPLFSYDKPDKRLSSKDAFYVKSIQTNGGVKGFVKPIGKATFYVSGGRKQPGCGVDLAGTCSHARSVLYYAEAVTENSFGVSSARTTRLLWTRIWQRIRMRTM
ncbi:GM10147 [Drosophila sechellia]|uniref:GM10147 n=1 Tax=Drosophila sechellia TaxID=7238 RepID=B4IC22_DROSE|nr:GM10147 [Drosophila sechellia]